MAGPYNTSGQEKILLGFEKINEMYLSYQCILFSTYKKKNSHELEDSPLTRYKNLKIKSGFEYHIIQHRLQK